MIRRRRRSGFVLLMVLVVVVLAGAALVGVARRSMLQAVDVKARAHALQRKWAVRSLRDTLLDRVARAFGQRQSDAKASDSVGPDQLRVDLRLSGREYLLVMTDEQARLNVNLLLADHSPGEVESTLRRLIDASGHELLLRPLSGTQLRLNPSLRRAAGGYGQIFPSASPADLVGLAGGDGLVDRITCWGDGRLNFARAHPDTVRALVNRALSPPIVEALISAREKQPDGDLKQWIGSLDQISRRDAHEIRHWLTDRSNCFGLWIVTGNGRRKWYHFAVGHRDGAAPKGQADRRRRIRDVKAFSW
jgi:hypothetical protein